MKLSSRGKPLVIIITIVLLFILLFPFFVMLSTMVRPSTEVYLSPQVWISEHFRFYNFIDVWSQYNLGTYFFSSFIIAVGSMVLNIALSIPAGYAIARLRFPGKRFALYFFLIVQMFSPVIVVISLFRLFSIFHLRDTFIGLIVIDTVFTLAFSIWLMNGYFSTIPKEIEEAAFIDGCTRVGTITRIMIPIAAPGLVTTMIYTFIYAWNEFLFALSFINTKDKMPLTVGIYNFVGRWSTQWEYLTTAAFLAIIPVIILFYFIEKQLVAGLAGGAVKG
ncbi:MAG TPA: carbohydrate ABC transporter permease [Spirochaetia bacterium]|nr:carbohydrate ABC transporter permease [Spirochaetia bacterium]